MDLDEYIRSKPYGEHARIAKAADVFYTTITAIRKRRSKPTYATAKRISEATGGAVTIEDLCEPQPEVPA
jgi:DNA-binding XRE family transcriptional regulator